MPTLADQSVDMILCDLPYGTTACSWDSIIPLEPLWREYKRISKPNGAIVLTAQQPFTTTLIASNMKWFRYCWVWQKTMATGFMNAKRMPLKAHEDIAVFYPRLPTYNPQMMPGEPRTVTRPPCEKGGVYGDIKRSPRTEYAGERYPRSVLTFKHDNRRNDAHPTAKPVALMEYMIRTYSQHGETVLDNCCGGGSTLIAAINAGRKWIGIERDEKYYEMARQRIENAKASNQIP